MIKLTVSQQSGDEDSEDEEKEDSSSESASSDSSDDGTDANTVSPVPSCLSLSECSRHSLVLSVSL